MTEPSLSLEQRGFEYGVKHLLTPHSGFLLDILAECLTMSYEEVSGLMSLGAIYVKGQRQIENQEFAKDTYMRVHTKPRRFPANDQKWNERIIFENSNFLVVNKPSGIPCHPSVDNTRENILSYLAQEFKREFFLTHRLDIPTSGILVIAKNKEFQSAFNILLAERGLDKIYRAICTKSAPALGLHRHFMQPSPRAPKSVTSEAQEGYIVCDLEVLSVLSREKETFEVKIKLLTGRTHQIRAQLSALGSPIQGDHMYGAEKIYSDERIGLTACELKFTDPLLGQEHHFRI